MNGFKGYGIGDVSAYASSYTDLVSANGYAASKTAETSAIKFKFEKISDVYDTTLAGSFHTKAINFTPYKTINFTVSRVQGYLMEQYAVDCGDIPLRAFILGTDKSVVVNNIYYNPGKIGTSDVTPPSGEVTGSINLSNVNIAGYLVVQLYLYRNRKSISVGINHTSYLHRLWFT